MKSRAGMVLAISVAVLVLLAVVAGVLSATRPRASLPEGSPEEVVQQYVTDVFDRDLDGAAGHLDPEGDCDAQDLEMAFVEPAARVVLRSTEVDDVGATATVLLNLVHTDNAPFGGGEWTQEERFRLTDLDGRWVITGDPWPMYHCAGPE